MKLNKKLVAFGLVLLVLFWIGNIVCYQKHVLKEPLFLKQYYDDKTVTGDFQLYYIQNINDNVTVTNIIFPEIGNQSYFFNDNESYASTDRKYYKLKAITINIITGFTGEMKDAYKNKVITKAKVYLSNGKVMNVDLGKIYLCSDEEKNSELKQYCASSSSDNTGCTSFTAEKDTNVIGINSKSYEEVKDILKINVNGETLNKVNFPIKLKRGDELKINYSFNFSKTDLRKNNIYELSLNVLTEDLSGNKGSSPCFIDYKLNSIKNYDIDAMKNIRGRQ